MGSSPFTTINFTDNSKLCACVLSKRHRIFIVENTLLLSYFINLFYSSKSELASFGLFYSSMIVLLLYYATSPKRKLNACDGRSDLFVCILGIISQGSISEYTRMFLRVLRSEKTT